MKRIIIIVFTLVASVMTGLSQENSIPFQVNINYPPLSISQDQLFSANNLTDLNRMYKDEWVREYISVEISSTKKNQVNKVFGENFFISQEQKEFFKQIEFPASITVSVKYIPENSLKDNKVREEKFTFLVHPNKSASFVGGQNELEKYLQKEAVSKIPTKLLKEYDLAVVKFTINELGQVVDTSIFQSTKDDDIDALLYQVICDMPDWTPAEYSNGEKVRQEFAFTIGNHESCIINLLNTVNNMY